jgi:hypothetical protein
LLQLHGGFLGFELGSFTRAHGGRSFSRGGCGALRGECGPVSGVAYESAGDGYPAPTVRAEAGTKIKFITARQIIDSRGNLTVEVDLVTDKCYRSAVYSGAFTRIYEALESNYMQDYEYVAIFDADFQPNSDFLKLTVPHFRDNPELALVQARWSFVNEDENLLTRLQNINLSFHFEGGQQVNGVFLNYFRFNGTIGVWWIKALEELGGWLDRTTVEDMDIAVQAHLQGWKFIFLNDVRSLCELPDSYEVYHKQLASIEEELSDTDFRRVAIPFFQGENLEKNKVLLTRVAKIAKAKKCTTS